MASVIEDQSAAVQRRMFLIQHDSGLWRTGIGNAKLSPAGLCDCSLHYFSRMESAIEIAGRSGEELVMA
jgi:hypothetical protein